MSIKGINAASITKGITLKNHFALPVIPWVGGKRKLAKTILPLFPEHTCYVEPFCGGAAMFFMKEPSDVEVLNDINSDIVNLYRVVQNHLEEFIRQFKWALTSREIFTWATNPQNYNLRACSYQKLLFPKTTIALLSEMNNE